MKKKKKKKKKGEKMNIASQLMVILERVCVWVYVCDPIDPPNVSIHTRHTVICMH